ncbi:MAG TPA: hypothetical protein VIJ07_16910 [Dermatophilaceae bacterium]
MTARGDDHDLGLALPSDVEVAASRRIYLEAEPRDLTYKVARHLVDQWYAGDRTFSRADGVAILLASWNAGFYRFRPAAGRTLVADLATLIDRHDDTVRWARLRNAADYDPAVDGERVEVVFRDFVNVLWPVGTAKALHVLAPTFFPIWDESIAAAFRLRLSPPAASVASYLRLMAIASRFAKASGFEDALKALDEWAYVKFTLARARDKPGGPGVVVRDLGEMEDWHSHASDEREVAVGPVEQAVRSTFDVPLTLRTVAQRKQVLGIAESRRLLRVHVDADVFDLLLVGRCVHAEFGYWGRGEE